LVEENRLPGEKHQPATSYWQIYNIMLHTSPWAGFELTTSVVIGLNTINHKNQSYARQLSILTNRTTTLSKFGMYVADWLVETMTLTRPLTSTFYFLYPGYQTWKYSSCLQ
jgi:hypothetical protein